MEKHIVGENGISYTLGADGLYYQDLMLPKGTNYQIGRYGRMRAEYIKEHHHSMHLELLFAGKWNEYLHGVRMLPEAGTSGGADESRCRSYGKAEGNRSDEMGWINE